MPEGSHPLPCDVYGSCGHASCAVVVRGDDLPRGRGWAGIPFVEIDGVNWPLDFAAKMLDIPAKDLTDLVRIVGLQPAGTIKMASYRRQGRQPRAFEAAKLIRITEMIRKLSEELAALQDPVSLAPLSPAPQDFAENQSAKLVNPVMFRSHFSRIA